LLNESKKYITSKQILRVGTSIGANAMEAQNAESKPDTIHKSKLLQKRQMKLSIGFCYAITPKAIRIVAIYF